MACGCYKLYEGGICVSAINILDVTLRDGGIVNNFNFGEGNMKSILMALENSGIKFIELGYLEKNTGTERGRSQYCDEKVIEKYFLTQKKPGVTYFTMIDYGKFDIGKLGERSENGIDAIRLAFHKRNYYEALPLYDELSQKGYDVYMQPMVTLHYTNDELKRLVDTVNEMNIKGVYFVDTFGQMQQPDVERIALLFDERLKPGIAIGFHSHNNIQMAYSNAITFLKLPIVRDRMIDSSVMGMGRGAGNLNTELILSYLNKYYGGQYTIPPLLNVMDTVLEPIRAQYPWGYASEYYLSSISDCSPIYANYYHEKQVLSMEQLNELLGMLKGEKRISFDKEYAEIIYRQYNGKEPYNDNRSIETIKAEFFGKTVCVLAPGKSLKDEQDKVKEVIKRSDITVSLNCDPFGSDYELTTRISVFHEALNAGKTIIAPSSVTRTQDRNIHIIDYFKWITVDDETYDSAGFMILNLLAALGVKEIYLAGFDGFDVNVNKNYFDESLKRSFSPESIAKKNRVFGKFVMEKQKLHSISFVTKTIYEN